MLLFSIYLFPIKVNKYKLDMCCLKIYNDRLAVTLEVKMRVICTIGQSYFVRRAKQFSILPLDKQPIQSDAKPYSMTALSRFHKQARHKKTCIFLTMRNFSTVLCIPHRPANRKMMNGLQKLNSFPDGQLPQQSHTNQNIIKHIFRTIKHC